MGCEVLGWAVTPRPWQPHTPLSAEQPGGTPQLISGEGLAPPYEITATSGPQGLGTVVNGGTSCTSGLCAVTGGTQAGTNLFHRFDAFNTSGGQITGASIDNATGGASHVFVGVLSPTLIDRTVGLTSPGSLTCAASPMSPRGPRRGRRGRSGCRSRCR